MRARHAAATLLLLSTHCALPQAPLPIPAAPVSPAITLNVTTTLVQVPTLVQTPSNDLVFALTASDFRLTDNGLPQRLTLDAAATAQPLSLVLLLQTGANAPRLFPAYTHLSTMLEPLLKVPGTEVSVVTFDSQPEAALPFTTDLSPWFDAIEHPEPGDHLAAILEALNFSLDLLAQQPPDRRRAILLLSQPHDLGSKSSLNQTLRRLGETDTAVYSLTFSSAEASLKSTFKDAPHLNPPIAVFGSAYFNLSEPLGMILTAMQTNSAAELASLSGGEALAFNNRQQFEASLNTLANHLPNQYLLTFQPTNPSPGLHTLSVGLPAHPGLHISARTAYWSAVPASKP